MQECVLGNSAFGHAAGLTSFVFVHDPAGVEDVMPSRVVFAEPRPLRDALAYLGLELPSPTFLDPRNALANQSDIENLLVQTMEFSTNASGVHLVSMQTDGTMAAARPIHGALRLEAGAVHQVTVAQAGTETVLALDIGGEVTIADTTRFNARLYCTGRTSPIVLNMRTNDDDGLMVADALRYSHKRKPNVDLNKLPLFSRIAAKLPLPDSVYNAGKPLLVPIAMLEKLADILPRLSVPSLDATYSPGFGKMLAFGVTLVGRDIVPYADLRLDLASITLRKTITNTNSTSWSAMIRGAGEYKPASNDSIPIPFSLALPLNMPGGCGGGKGEGVAQ